MSKDHVCQETFKQREKWRWLFTLSAKVANFRASVKRQLSPINQERFPPAGEREEKAHRRL